MPRKVFMAFTGHFSCFYGVSFYGPVPLCAQRAAWVREVWGEMLYFS